MALDYDTIAKNRGIKKVEEDSKQYPEGFISGGILSVDAEGRLNISSINTNVFGKTVTINESYQISESDFIGAVQTDKQYYIYLSPDGKYYCDYLAPVWEDRRYSYAHPSRDLRLIGAFYYTSAKEYEQVTSLPILYGILNDIATLLEFINKSGLPVLVNNATYDGSSTVQINGILSQSGAHVFTSDAVIRRNTSDGSDSGSLSFTAGGGLSTTRGAYFVVYGNERPSTPGWARIVAGDVSGGKVQILTGTGVVRFEINDVGRTLIGATLPTDDGANNLQLSGSMRLSGNIIFDSGNPVLRANTSDGSDTATLSITGGGTDAIGRGAISRWYGNEVATFGGSHRHILGDLTGSYFDILRSTGVTFFRANNSGRVLINTTADDGSSALQVNGPTRLDGNLTLGTGSADRTINFAGDAALLWDESEDNFNFNKPVLFAAGQEIVSGEVIKKSEVAITAWDMDTDAAKGVNHGITNGNLYIKRVSVMIFNDAATAVIPFETGGVVSAINSTQILLQRTASGAFDNANFSSTGSNRGFILIEYEV